jgi:lipid II:glycine glycyltransferase (peptidoglycan interpeptide bridge formation enzyme)
LYYRGADRVSLLHSASVLPSESDADLRAIIGRANRRLHWEDMVFFRSEGVATYDLGGWYIGQRDQRKLGINIFKEQFGGRVVQEYNCDLRLTSRAKVLARVPKGLRKLASRAGHSAHLDVQ